MGQFRKGPAEKREAWDKGLGELMELFLKLNSKIREKIYPRAKEGKGKKENVEMVIIILNSSSEKAPRLSRPEKPKFSWPNWIDQLCEEIERKSGKEKTS